jgi:hypothetical protein
MYKNNRTQVNNQFLSKIIMSVAVLLLALSGCDKVEEPKPLANEPSFQFPDPVLGDFLWDASINGYWVLDSMMERYTNTEGKTVQLRKFPKNTGAGIGFVNISDNQFEWLADEKSLSGAVIYDSTGIGFQNLYDDRLAVVINLSDTKLAFCYNLSDYTGDSNNREMYFFTRK